jgi:Uncharacterized conserved protein
MNELRDFVTLSKYAGQRFDLVQAGGGNTSVKLDNGTMLIKASGISLSEVEEAKGFVTLDLLLLQNIFEDKVLGGMNDKKEREAYVNACVQKAVIGGGKPSIETLLHARLDKYVLHTHPLVVNAVVCKSTWREIIAVCFNEDLVLNGVSLHYVCIPYKTPGIELAFELGMHKPAQIIFLQNHGLIVSARDYKAVIDVTEQVLIRLEQYVECCLDPYKLSTKISKLFDFKYVAYLSQDRLLQEFMINRSELFYTARFCPDTVVYCGTSCVELKNLHHVFTQEGVKIILYDNKIFFLANSVRKARECEEVFKAHLMTLVMAEGIEGNVEFFSEAECNYLMSWDAEKYRQGV